MGNLSHAFALALAAGAPLQQQPGAARSDAPAEVVRWLAVARPLATLEDGQGVADLEPLRAIVGDARIVALGEATHGSHEFFEFKRRAFEFLVSEAAFTDFAMETGFTDALTANAWVEHGEGDLASALTGLAGLWRTE